MRPCPRMPNMFWCSLRHSFKSLKFLLTDSKVARDTKALVAGVAKKKAEVCTVPLPHYLA